MEQPGVVRKLLAILAADVVGYSRLMQTDDRETLQALTERRALFSKTVEKHEGRIVNAPGDSILAEFASALKAVECAVDLQRILAESNSALPENRRMLFRIGVNLGDVLVDTAGVYGDGVNVAARLESLAGPGGICISRSVQEQVKNRLQLGYEDLGELQVKNIAEPVRAFRVNPDADAPPVSMFAACRSHSIAVLAFDNMSGDAEQELLCESISEDVITDLSKISGIGVIARQSAFTYKGKTNDLRRVGKELGVRYVLQGSVRKSGNRVRVTAQLVETESGMQLWGNKYERDIGDVFLMGDEITEEIVTVLDVKLGRGEDSRIWRRAFKSPRARDEYNRAWGYYQLSTQEDNRRARELFLEVTRIEPETAVGHAYVGITHCLDVIHGWSGEPRRSLDEALRYGRIATDLDPASPGGHFAQGVAALFEHRHDDAIAAAEKAVELRPMCATPRAGLAYVQLYSGLWASAIRSASDAVEFNPIYPTWYRYLMCAAQHHGGQHEQALAALRALCAANPRLLPGRMVLIGAQGALGKWDDARREAAALIREQPNLSVGKFADTQPFRDAGRRDNYIKALREAGLPG